MLAIIAAAVACGIIGAGTGYFYRKKIAEGKIGQAEIEAQRAQRKDVPCRIQKVRGTNGGVRSHVPPACVHHARYHR